MIELDHIPWTTWLALTLLSVALGAILGSIIHERRVLKSASIVALVAALCLVTAGTWR